MSLVLKSSVATALRAVMSLRVWLAGKKTYSVLALTLLYSLGVQRGWWEGDLTVWTLLGSSAAITIRATIVRMVLQFLDDITKATATPPQPNNQ